MRSINARKIHFGVLLWESRRFYYKKLRREWWKKFLHPCKCHTWAYQEGWLTASILCLVIGGFFGGIFSGVTQSWTPISLVCALALFGFVFRQYNILNSCARVHHGARPQKKDVHDVATPLLAYLLNQLDREEAKLIGPKSMFRRVSKKIKDIRDEALRLEKCFGSRCPVGVAPPYVFEGVINTGVLVDQAGKNLQELQVFLTHVIAFFEKRREEVKGAEGAFRDCELTEELASLMSETADLRFAAIKSVVDVVAAINYEVSLLCGVVHKKLRGARIKRCIFSVLQGGSTCNDLRNMQQVVVRYVSVDFTEFSD